MKYYNYIALFIFSTSISMAHETPIETKIETSNKTNQSIKHYSSEVIENLSLPFSEAVIVGDIIFLSGQIGIDGKTGKLVEGGIKNEAKQAMNNIKQTLKALGHSMKDIFKCTVMLADIAEWQSFNEVYITYFSKPFPARSAFGASGLGFNSRVEIECIAAVRH